MRKIRKGDNVVVITGKDKGKRGAVATVVDGDRVVVEGVNRAKKHVKPNPMRNQPGGIVEMDRPIHVSNVAIINPTTQGADRVGFKILDDGRKVRVFKSNGEMVDA
jgi:large subunit ribosomal protein L24